MGVSWHRGTPKWMVYNGKSHLEVDDLGVPLFQETPFSIAKEIWYLVISPRLWVPLNLHVPMFQDLDNLTHQFPPRMNEVSSQISGTGQHIHTPCAVQPGFPETKSVCWTSKPGCGFGMGPFFAAFYGFAMKVKCPWSCVFLDIQSMSTPFLRLSRNPPPIEATTWAGLNKWHSLWYTSQTWQLESTMSIFR